MSLYCKCILGNDSNVLELPSDKKCTDCSSNFCINDPYFKDAPKDKTFKAVCFQRESIKDEIMVSLFLSITLLLVVMAIVKPYFLKWWKARKRATSFSSMAHQTM